MKLRFGNSFALLAVSSANILLRVSAMDTAINLEPDGSANDSNGLDVTLLSNDEELIEVIMLLFVSLTQHSSFISQIHLIMLSLCIAFKPEAGNEYLEQEGSRHGMLRKVTKQVDDLTVKLDTSTAGEKPHRELQLTVKGITWRFGESALWAFDCDFPNMGDYKQVYNTKGEECDPICRGDPLCTNFAWSQGTCYLKKGGAIYSDAKQLNAGSGVVCGVKNIEWQESLTASWAFDCDFPFVGDYKQVYNTKGEECDPLCAGESACTGFAWNKGTCFLKDKSPVAAFGNLSVLDARKLVGSGIVCGSKKPKGWLQFGKNIFQYNCDFPNRGDYKQIYNQLAFACGSFCNADTKCTHYAWNKGTCFLKTGGASKTDAVMVTSPGLLCAIKQ